jgi:hypothetical protein
MCHEPLPRVWLDLYNLPKSFRGGDPPANSRRPTRLLWVVIPIKHTCCHRKHKLARLVRAPRPGIVVNEHYDGDGDIVFKYACKLGCEGIVSKRLGSPYRSGRFTHWIKVENLKAPAVRREAEEDWR